MHRMHRRARACLSRLSGPPALCLRIGNGASERVFPDVRLLRLRLRLRLRLLLLLKAHGRCTEASLAQFTGRWT